jgi:hypothetical protein
VAPKYADVNSGSAGRFALAPPPGVAADSGAPATNAAGFAGIDIAARVLGAACAGSSCVSRVSHPSLPSRPNVPIVKTAAPMRTENAIVAGCSRA